MKTDIIKEFEGLKLSAYLDSVGVPTIGYGCTFYPNGRKVKMGDKLSGNAEAENLLTNVIQVSFLPKLSKIPTWNQMNQHQQSAVLSFAYNLGAGFFGASNFNSITRLLSNPATWRNKQEVERVFGLYVRAGGQTLPGLVRRRKAEAELFNS